MQSSEFSLAAASCLSPHHLTHGDSLGLFNSSYSRRDLVSVCTETEPVNQTNDFQEWCYFSHHPLQERLTDMLSNKLWPVRSWNCRLVVKKHSPRKSLHPFWAQGYSHYSSSSRGTMSIMSLLFEDKTKALQMAIFGDQNIYYNKLKSKHL